MFAIVSKIAFFFLRPSNLILFVLIGGIVLSATNWRRTGRAAIVVAGLCLLLAGLGPVGNLLFLPLEGRFPIAVDISRPPHGIVVLGGAVDTVVGERHGVVTLAEAGERITAAVDLAGRFSAAKIVLSGGKPALLPGELREADETVSLLVSLGVARDRIIVENESRNTWQNAVYSREAAKPGAGERWLLVTSAYHMPRAIGVFRRAGWASIEAYPVDFRSTGDFAPFPSVSKGLRYTDIAVREWIGLLAYRLTGRTDTLLPGPSTAAR